MARVLVIDDDAALRLAMAKTLRKEGHCVESAGTGREGLEKLRDERPEMFKAVIRRLRFEVAQLQRLQENDPQAFQAALEEGALRYRSMELASQIRQTDDPERRKALTAELRGVVERLLEAEQRAREAQVRELEERRAKLQVRRDELDQRVEDLERTQRELVEELKAEESSTRQQGLARKIANVRRRIKQLHRQMSRYDRAIGVYTTHISNLTAAVELRGLQLPSEEEMKRVAVEVDAADEELVELSDLALSLEEGAAGETADPEVAAILEEFGIERPFVLQMGSFEQRRGLDLALEAVTEVREGYPNLDLVLVGEVRARVDELSDPPQWVRRLGRVDDVVLPALFAGAEAVLSPSRDEGFDFPLLEALTCGAVVVASDIPVHREHFEPAVVLFESGRADALAAGIRTVLEDVAVAVRRRKAVDHASRFSWENVARRHLDLWRRVVR